jgi:hypothetical protein
MSDDLSSLFREYVDVPDWEKSADDPAPALAHQMLIEIAAAMGFRLVLEDRIKEILSRSDDTKDLITDLAFLRAEVTSDLQHALHGHELGEECRKYEMEWPATLKSNGE